MQTTNEDGVSEVDVDPVIDRLLPLREHHVAAQAAWAGAQVDKRSCARALIRSLTAACPAGKVILLDGESYVVRDRHSGTVRIPDAITLNRVDGGRTYRVRVGAWEHSLPATVSKQLRNYYDLERKCFELKAAVHRTRTTLRHEVETVMPVGTKVKINLAGMARYALVTGYDDHRPSHVILLVHFDTDSAPMVKDVLSRRLGLTITFIPEVRVA